MFDSTRLQEEGKIASTPEEAQQLDNQGYVRCRNLRCDFWVSPQAQEAAWNNGKQYQCPNCSMTYGLLDPTPFGNVNGGSEFTPGGGTLAGIDMTQQGDIGEEIVKNLGQIPGYGPITWWSEVYNSPLDGAVGKLGIEVKTVAMDALHHKFVVSSPRDKELKNEMAARMGLTGILGLLVVLDYSRSVADIYAQEFSLNVPRTVHGNQYTGVGSFRKNTGQHLVVEVPFKNPLLDPKSVQPEQYQTKGHGSEDDIPF